MRLDVTPRRASLTQGRPVTLTATVTNTGTVISGYRVRVLGLDPTWVAVDPDGLSLFPGTGGTALLTVTLPSGIPAGMRSFEVEVRSLTEPEERATATVELSVPSQASLELRVDPTSVTGGREAHVSVIVTNTGSAVANVPLTGRDDTGTVQVHFDPATPELAPGEQVVAAARLRAKRPWFGSPKVRPYRVEAGSSVAPVVAQGAWVQHPRFSRGALALAGLVVAATVFAVVISATLSQVVNQSNANRQLALQVAQANQTKPALGTASISGTVDLLTTGTPEAGVTVDLFAASDTTSPVVSTATGATGGYHFSGLAAGSYDLRFTGGGFAELWYPDSLTAANAKAVTLSAGTHATGIDIHIGGLPATVSGQVTGADPAGAVLTVQLPTAQPVQSLSASSTAGSGSSGGSPAPSGSGGSAGSGGSSPGSGSSAAPAASGAVGGEAAAGTVVTTVTLGSSGTFHLTDIPSPATYQLVVTKTGDAPAVQEIALGGGENRSGVTIVLSPGDGVVSGTVSGPSGPVGAATVTATAGTTSETTVTATTPGQLGDFTLDNLPTPATVSLQFSAPGDAAQTLSVSLATDQHLSGLAVTLQPGVGSISGVVTTPSGTPAGGVSVTTTVGQTTVSTVTASVGRVGSYTLTGLPVPGTYTVGFSRSDLVSQTLDVALTTADPSPSSVDESMVSATAVLTGTVTQSGGGGLPQITVTLVSGSTTYQVTTATSPVAGAYAIDGVAPGTYTVSFTRPGGVPVSSIVTLAAGQHRTDNPVLAPAASIIGTVVESTSGTPVPGAQVLLYLANQYPATVTATTTTDSAGDFTFTDIAAPQDYLVAVAYPAGSSPQLTVPVTAVAGQAVGVCGDQATGAPPGAGSSSSGTSSAASSTGSSSTGSSSAGSSSPSSSSSGASSSGTSCDPTTDPLEVSVS